MRLTQGPELRFGMNARSDIIFEGMADAFLQEVYGTTKGDVRLHVLWHDLCTEIPALNYGGLRVIDVGAGDGRIARRISALRHEVTLCEPSYDMLERARASFHDAGLIESAHFVHSTAQGLKGRVVGQFDLVICHAVLEWLAEPKETLLTCILPLLKSDGYLPLMFYNRNSAILRRIMRGDFAGPVEKFKSDPVDSRMPVPLDSNAVRSWLARSGLRIVSKAGIRIFHDHIPEKFRSQGKLEDLLHVETEFRKQEPFASLGQHTHLVCKWK